MTSISLARPLVITEDEVESLGGLLKLSPSERTEVADFLGIEESQITNGPLFRVIGDSAWKPRFLDILKFLHSATPASHNRELLIGFVRNLGQRGWAKSSIELPEPETQLLRRFDFAYPYAFPYDHALGVQT